MKAFTLLLFLVSISATAQTEKIKTLTLSDTILYSAIDRTGDFYAITKSGQIQRFNGEGELTLLYKAPEVPTIFDPRDGARLFAYYRSDQHYEYLSPSFQITASFKIDPSFAIQPWLICPSGDHKLWMVDHADNSLKKVDVRSSEVQVEVVVDSASIGDVQAFTTMREYQNFVFLLDPDTGLFIFNSLGRHIKTIGSAGIERFNFLGEELYFLHNGKLEFFNLFSAETRDVEVDPAYTDALVTEETLILFTPETIDIYSFRP